MRPVSFPARRSRRVASTNRPRTVARRPSGRCAHARGRPRGSRKIRAMGACAMRKTPRRSGTFQAGIRAPMRLRHACPPVRGGVRGASRGTHAHRRKCLKQAVCKACVRVVPTPGRIRATRRWSAVPPSAVRMRVVAPENICGKVLTVEKTVIRFRPNNRVPPQRVGFIKQTAHGITRCSARMDSKVGSGVVSPKKTQHPSGHRPASPGDAGFFMRTGAALGHAGARTERPAHPPAQRIRTGAPCALAVVRGSDTRGGFHWAGST